jgi:prophage regulatory protein
MKQPIPTGWGSYAHQPKALAADRLLRLSEVLQRVGMGKSSWYVGVRANRYPQPVRLGTRSVRWSEAEIDAFIERMKSDAHTAGHRDLKHHLGGI